MHITWEKPKPKIIQNGSLCRVVISFQAQQTGKVNIWENTNSVKFV